MDLNSKSSRLLIAVTNTCQESFKSLGSISPASRSLPGGPWKRLHVDFEEPYQGKCSQLWLGYLFKILAGIVSMTHVTSAKSSASSRLIFGYSGLPEHLVTNKGRPVYEL